MGEEGCVNACSQRLMRKPCFSASAMNEAGSGKRERSHANEQEYACVCHPGSSPSTSQGSFRLRNCSAKASTSAALRCISGLYQKPSPHSGGTTPPPAKRL